MHITGGQARGLRIQAPPGKQTRPTTDRVRESLFAILKDLVPGAHVVDLYAGSGSLGLEAASRGAASVTWVEQHAKTCALLKENASRLAPAGVKCPAQVVCAEVGRWLARPHEQSADLIFADPPYALFQDGDSCTDFLRKLQSSRLLSADSLVVIELSGRIRPMLPPAWSELRRQDYGTTSMLLLELKETVPANTV